MILLTEVEVNEVLQAEQGRSASANGVPIDNCAIAVQHRLHLQGAHSVDDLNTLKAAMCVHLRFVGDIGTCVIHTRHRTQKSRQVCDGAAGGRRTLSCTFALVDNTKSGKQCQGLL